LGDDGNAGTTKSTPKATLAAAIDKAVADGKPVYACAETFTEAITVPAGVTLYGGLDCANGWTYISTTNTTIEPGADQVPMTLLGGTGVTKIDDVLVRAANATVPGGSSIAAIVDGATAELSRCSLIAGAGAAGENGESFAADPALNGTPGNPGANACMGDPMNGNPGGMSVTKACDGSEMTVGGKGGDGGKVDPGPPLTPLAAGDGEDGQPAGTIGMKGLGEPEMGAWNCIVGGGQLGDNGAAGAPGAGAMDPGTLSASGYTGVSGAAGMNGKAGQGGGGSGGAKGGTNICTGGIEGAGASGGSGGSGGCGGKGGGGGRAGGASIALISLNANVTLSGCTLFADQGGNGGAGGDWQTGGLGGSGGIPGIGSSSGSGSTDACSGGIGGKGGSGGPGGGGVGGHSIGIAHTGTAPQQLGTVTIMTASAGMSGSGGNLNSAGNAGANGIAAEVQAF
jgi:hypothetical protein